MKKENNFNMLNFIFKYKLSQTKKNHSKDSCMCNSCHFKRDFLTALKEIYFEKYSLAILENYFLCEKKDKLSSNPFLSIYGQRYVDFPLDKISSTLKYALIKTAFSIGMKGIGISSSYLYLDDRENKSLYLTQSAI